MLQHGTNERGLARADLSGQRDEAFTPADAVEKFLEGRRVLGASEQKPRVSRQAERFFQQAVVRLVGEREETGR